MGPDRQTDPCMGWLDPAGQTDRSVFSWTQGWLLTGWTRQPAVYMDTCMCSQTAPTYTVTSSTHWHKFPLPPPKPRLFLPKGPIHNPWLQTQGLGHSGMGSSRFVHPPIHPTARPSGRVLRPHPSSRHTDGHRHTDHGGGGEGSDPAHLGLHGFIHVPPHPTAHVHVHTVVLQGGASGLILPPGSPWGVCAPGWAWKRLWSPGSPHPSLCALCSGPAAPFPAPRGQKAQTQGLRLEPARPPPTPDTGEGDEGPPPI